MKKEYLISEALCLPPTAIEYHMSLTLAKLFPDKTMIEGDMPYFNVEAYAQAQFCTLMKKNMLYNQVMTYWRVPEPEMMPIRGMDIHIEPISNGMDPGLSATNAEHETTDQVKNAWLEVQWEGHAIDVLIMNWGETHTHYHYWILADGQDIARHFFASVCKWNMEIRGEVLVFEGGNWHKDEHLFQNIKNATFDNLILRGSLKEEIFNDLTQFFASRATYEEYGIPWKRGILFVGPPGNGKTHAVKAIINSLQQPCLYVKSVHAPHGADEFFIREIFDRARRTAPCLLIIEDLDAQLTPQNRSFFLNELDGFAANIGVVTLATTNHPERLDPAILDRPSRFDRKYPFDLPEQPERQAYITMWNTSLKPLLRLSDDGTTKISEITEGFSFAYLKELFLSSMMRWIANREQGTMEQVMIGQVATLREQMVSANALTEAESAEEQQMLTPPRFGPMMARRIMFHRGM